MSKYIYLGTDGNRLLFYNPKKDEFYSAEEGYFGVEIDKDFETFDDLQARNQEAKEQAVLITDPYEIKALKIAYESINNYSKKERQLKKAIKALSKREKEEKNATERKKNIFLLYSILSLTLTTFHTEIQNLISGTKGLYGELVESYQEYHQNDEAHLESFYESISSNSTMSAELKEKYRSIFLSIAISDAYLSDSRVKSICRRLENFNFENYNESNYSKTIPYILFGKSNTLNNYVAISLSEFIDERPSSDKTIMFGMLNIGVENLKLTTILNGDEEEYIRLLAGNYNTTEESISYLLSILSSYDKADNDQTKEEYQREFYEKLGTILLDFYRNKDKENYQELDYEVLSSQIFDGDFTIHNNIFSDKIIVNFDDPNYGKYELYYDAKTRYPISHIIYYEKLVKLINERGNNLDYNDPDSRFLIYLVTLANNDYVTQNSELINAKMDSDLAEIIMNNLFYKNFSYVYNDPTFLYAYLSNGRLNISDIIREVRTPKNDAFSIALFKEFDHCLRIELSKGNISLNEYNEKLEKILNNIKESDEALYNLLLDSILYDNSLFEELKISPFSYSFQNDDIKKYIYTPEEN